MKKIVYLFLLIANLIFAQNFADHVIDDTTDGVSATFAIDIDNDTDTDVISVSYFDDELAWYENDGSQNFTKHSIDNAVDGAIFVTAADGNGDEFVDILINTFDGNQVIAYLNDGNQNFTKVIIDNASMGSNYNATHDIDGDNNIDIFVAAFNGDEIARYYYDGVSSFVKIVIDANVNGASSVVVRDINGDGENDLLVTKFGDYGTAVDGELIWYENDGSENFTKHVIDNQLISPSLAFELDFDSNGVFGDLLVTDSEGNEVIWYESDGNANFTKHSIDNNLAYASFATPVDFNNDNFTDFVVSETDSNQLSWFKNDGSQNFTKHIIANTSTIGGAFDSFGLYVNDLDQDGDFDIFCAALAADTLYWFENNFNQIPTNDDCANAETLIVYAVDASIGNETLGDTTEASSSPIANTSCDGVPTNYDVFYEFTVPVGETGVVVYTSGDTGNQIETVLLDSCSGSEVSGTCQANGTTHLFSGLTSGQTYTLQVWHDLSEFTDNRGAFNIAIELVPPTPSNDLCANPINLIVGTSNTENVVIGNNINTTDSGELTPTCADYAGGDLWYEAIVPNSGELTIETLEANGFPDGGLAVYSGSCGSLTQIDCDDDSGQGRMSKIELTGQTPGDTILIRVWELDNNRIGKFGVVAYDPNPASISDLTTFGFKYYPNPVLNKLYLSANQKITDITIYNILGQEVKQLRPFNINTEINLSSLTNGTYFVKAQINNAVGTFKIIKK